MIARLLTTACLLTITMGCERPHSDMGQQDKALPYDRSAFFPDGTTARPLPAGTVPRADANVPRTPYATHRAPGPAAQPHPATADATLPFPISPDVLSRGQVAFD